MFEFLLEAFKSTSSTPTLRYFIIVGFVGYAFMKIIKFVPEANLGLRMRFGRVVRDDKGYPKVYGPGMVVLIPQVEKLRIHPVRDQTMMLPDQVIILKDDTGWDVNATLKFRITDIYKALFEVDDLELGVRNFAMGKIRSILQQLAKYDEIKDVEKVSELLKRSMEQEQDQWGIKILDFHLVNCAPIAATASLISSKVAATARVDAYNIIQQAGVKDVQVIAAMLGVPVTATVSATKPEGASVRRTGEDYEVDMQ